MPRTDAPPVSTDDSAAAPPAAAVQSVGMAFEVLEALAQSAEAVGTSELARRLDQTKARVHRHLATLRELGFVEQDASSAYRLGWRAWRLSLNVGENFGLRKLAQPHLLRLHQDSGQTVALAAPAGRDIAVIDAIQSAGAVAITVRSGSVIPAATSALGRAILAFAPEAAAGSPEDDDPAPGSPGARRRLRELLNAVRCEWWAVASNERLPGVSALAAPVFDERDRVVASVGVIGSHTLVTDPPPAALLRQVQRAAAAISAELRSSAWAVEKPRPRVRAR
ncbi:IclR family transcriptional regulator [Ramlibacter sp. AN1015]|uniref:IclR family transcriptional regulator n=1 Tax=Ramlibacter sp. AN1015 TaxID=3133428 RepID=UPI0030C1E516